MYIKILVYMIDNQQVKYKISILFFGSLIVCRFCLPAFVGGGGGTKNGSPAGPISGRWSVPHIPHISAYPAYPTASRYFWLPSGFILKISYLWDKTKIMFRNILHKIKIFFCDDDVEKIYVRDSTVIRNNEIHRMYDEIPDELGDLSTVVSRNYVYGKIKDRTGLSIRHISRIINHTKVEEI